jgi:hypothetical protein
MVAHTRVPALRHWAIETFERFAPMALELQAARATAFTGLGAAAVLDCDPGSEGARRIVDKCGDFLERLLGGARRPDWTWFEAMIGYDNPRLSQALIECGRVTGNARWVAEGLETLRWVIERQCSAKDFFRPVGSESFGKTREILPFDQQPLEAWAAIDACLSASLVDQTKGIWIEHARRAYRWFLGDNDRGVPLVDIRFGSCFDGVTPRGANLNVGAESLLAFQLAYYSYTQLLLDTGPQWREDAPERHSQGLR